MTAEVVATTADAKKILTSPLAVKFTVYYHHIADWCTWVTNHAYHPRTSCVFHPRTSCIFHTYITRMKLVIQKSSRYDIYSILSPYSWLMHMSHEPCISPTNFLCISPTNVVFISHLISEVSSLSNLLYTITIKLILRDYSIRCVQSPDNWFLRNQ